MALGFGSIGEFAIGELGGDSFSIHVVAGSATISGDVLFNNALVLADLSSGAADLAGDISVELSVQGALVCDDIDIAIDLAIDITASGGLVSDDATSSGDVSPWINTDAILILDDALIDGAVSAAIAVEGDIASDLAQISADVTAFVDVMADLDALNATFDGFVDLPNARSVIGDLVSGSAGLDGAIRIFVGSEAALQANAADVTGEVSPLIGSAADLISGSATLAAATLIHEGRPVFVTIFS